MQRTLSLLSIAIGISLVTLLGIARLHTRIARTTSPTHFEPVLSHTLSSTAAYGKLPLAFESNQGQVDKQVQFLSHGPGYNLFLTANEAVLTLSHSAPAPKSAASQRQLSSPGRSLTAHRTRSKPPVSTTSVLRMKLLGANTHPQIVGQQQLPGTVNYFLGNDPAKWRTHVSTYSRVQYKGVYPGIDLVYYGNRQQLEYDWVVSPGSDVHQIQWEVTGAQKASLTASGDLKLHTAGGDIVQRAPVIYQEVDGVRKPVAGRLVLRSDPEYPNTEYRIPEYRSPNPEPCRIGFDVAAYDHTRPLVIDPVLVYSTYLGGSSGENGNGIAVDGSGNAYITGYTSSIDFPTKNPIQSVNNAANGGYTAFVTEINASGTALVYSTYLGGSGEDGGYGIAVDGSGNAYITGSTSSTDFPTQNPLQPANNAADGGGNAFVAEIGAQGTALVYSTYLGGSSGDGGYGIAVDGSGNAYITGYSDSTDFPTQNPLQPANNAADGGGNAFVAEIGAQGTALVYSTYLGGSNSDSGYGIAVDGSGNAYITGFTYSTDFPTKNPIQSTNKNSTNGGATAFVTEIGAQGTALVYSTYLGGSGGDDGYGIAVDGSGNAYITGSTYSTDFPTKNPIQSTNKNSANGGATAFVTKIGALGTALVYSTYLGGSGGDGGYGIAVDGSGNAYITGSTYSTDFPTQNPLQSVNNSPSDGNAFITKINASGAALVYSTYLGGSGGDYSNGIAVDGFGNAYITGITSSTDFPTQNPFQPGNHASDPSDGNVIVARIGNYNWQTVDVAVGSDDQARLFWNNTTHTIGLWSVNNTGTSSNLSNIGPFTGYAAQSLAAGSDGYTRMLWNKTDGTAALWILTAGNRYSSGYNFGPYAGWTATDVAVGSDNNARMLWTKSDGTAGVWTISNTGALSNLANFGPFAGWQATRIAAGSDGYTRVLWTKNDGSIGLWLLNANNSFNSGINLSGATGWNAVDIAVGSDNKTRLLWTKSDGTAGLWTVDTAGKYSNLTNFGPYKGWTATRLDAGSDGYTRLLWFKADGTQAVWLLNSNNSFNTGFNFGPY